MKLNNIEKYIKSKLQDHRDERSDGDLIWANISQELGEPSKPSPFAFLKKFKFYLFLSIPISLAGIAYFYHFKTLPIDAEISTLSIEKNNTDKDDRSIALEHQKSSNTAVGNRENEISLRKEISSQKTDNQEINSSITRTGSNEITDKQKQLSLKQNTFFDEENKTNELATIPLTIQHEIEEVANQMDATREEIINTENTSPKKQNITNQAISSIEKDNISNSLNALPITDVEPLTVDFRGLPFLQTISPIIEPVKPKSHWQILAYSGVQYAALNLSTASNNDLSKSIIETQSAELGWHSGIEVQHLSPSGWTFGGGLNYQKDWVNFEFQSQQMDSVLKENVIVKISINSETRDTIDRVYGDAAVATTTTYRVLHFNEFKRISMPLSIGYQKRKNKWIYGIDVGGNINLLLQQKGRLLSDNQLVVNYNKQSPIYHKITFAAHLRPHLAYQINPQWSLFARPNVQFSLDNIVETTSFSSLPMTGAVSFGVVLSL